MVGGDGTGLLAGLVVQKDDKLSLVQIIIQGQQGNSIINIVISSFMRIETSPILFF